MKRKIRGVHYRGNRVAKRRHILRKKWAPRFRKKYRYERDYDRKIKKRKEYV